MDSDVSTNQISFARVFPDGFETHLRSGAHLPVLRLDQEEKALVGDVQFISYKYDVLGNMRYSTSCIFPDDPIRQALYETVVVGDSGNPALLLLGGHPVLLTVWTSPFGGGRTSVTAFKSDINQLMTDLGGGYQLTEVDLSNFTQLP